MTRAIIIATLLIISSLGASAQAATKHRDFADREARCRFGSVDNARWTVHEVRLTIACAVHRWPVPGGLAKADAIAARESGFAWYARNPSSGTCGVFQHQPSLYPGRVQNFNRTHPAWHVGPSCFGGRGNVLVSIAMAHSGGWNPWGG